MLWYCLTGDFPFSDEEIQNNALDAKIVKLPSLIPTGTEEGLKTLILALLKCDPVERMTAKNFCGGNSADSGMDASMSPSNHLNQSTQSNPGQNSQPQSSSHSSNFSQQITNHGNVAGAVVIHQHTHHYHSGVPHTVTDVQQQALNYQDNYNRQPSQSSLSTSPPNSTPPHSSPSRSRRGLTFRHHPYNTSFSPRRRGSSNSSQDRSQNRSQNNRSQNLSQRQSLNGSLNYEFPPPAPAQVNGAPSQISNSYQSTPMLPWPSEHPGSSINFNPSTMQNHALNQNLPQHHPTTNTSQHNSFNSQNQALPASSNDQDPPPQQSDSTNTGFFGILGKIWPFKS